MHVVYIHGFASSPQSSKAQFFAKRFAARRVRFLCPDFNQPDFSTLTVSRMLEQLEKRMASLPPGDVVLIGSSLGGFVAVEASARQVSGARHPISRLVLLAPAVELEWECWTELGPGGIERWRQTGSVDVFHYAENKRQRLNFEFYEDAQKYRPAARRLNQPVLIFQGQQDDSVSPAIVEAFAYAQADSTLHLLEDGHQLTNSLEFIWLETARFLSLD
jgi:pimeloyl-ACP methyl ester carboxylesterase